MISAFWEMFKPLYAVDTLEGYTENEIAYLKELFGSLPRVLERSAAGIGGLLPCRRADKGVPLCSGHMDTARTFPEVGMAVGTGILDSSE